MHLAEGLLPPLHAAAWAAAAAPFVVSGVRAARHTTRDGEPAERALLAFGGVALFAVTLFPVPVPFVGMTSHLCGTPLLALLLGARAVVLPTLAVLVLQALFFAHGGLTTLGANLFTLGVVGPWVAVGLARLFAGLRLPPLWGLGLAAALADLTVYAVDAGLLGLALTGEQPFEIWFVRILAALAPVQAPLAVLEGALTALVLRALAMRRGELVPAWLRLAPATAACLLLGFFAPLALAGVGLDEAVFVETARAAGRSARGVLPEGELAEAATWVVAFLLGAFAHRSYSKLHQGRESQHASGR